jgi:hypothetical protein
MLGPIGFDAFQCLLVESRTQLSVSSVTPFWLERVIPLRVHVSHVRISCCLSHGFADVDVNVESLRGFHALLI